MVVEVRAFDVTVSPGSTPAAPVAFDLSMPQREVRWIVVQVPDGCRGVIGWALSSGGVQMFPSAGSPMIVVDGQEVRWELTGALNSGAWQMIAYNIGNFSHTLQISFGLDLITAPQVAGGGQLTGISAAGTGGEGGGTGVPLPPSPTLPVSLPPSPPPLPGSTPSTAQVDTLLIGVASLGQVWLLDENGYSQILDQTDADTLQQDGVPTVAVSGQMHANLIAQAGMPATLTLGQERISGFLIPPRPTPIGAPPPIHRAGPPKPIPPVGAPPPVKRVS